MSRIVSRAYPTPALYVIIAIVQSLSAISSVAACVLATCQMIVAEQYYAGSFYASLTEEYIDSHVGTLYVVLHTLLAAIYFGTFYDPLTTSKPAWSGMLG